MRGHVMSLLGSGMLGLRWDLARDIRLHLLFNITAKVWKDWAGTELEVRTASVGWPSDYMLGSS